MPPTSPFGSKFSFEPECGHLSGGEIQIIRVKLMSDLLGSFSEAFEWTIQGSSVPLMLQLKGNVTGPTYEVDTSVLDFGVVSYGFRWVALWGLWAWRGREERGDGEGRHKGKCMHPCLAYSSSCPLTAPLALDPLTGTLRS